MCEDGFVCLLFWGLSFLNLCVNGFDQMGGGGDSWPLFLPQLVVTSPALVRFQSHQGETRLPPHLSHSVFSVDIVDGWVFEFTKPAFSFVSSAVKPNEFLISDISKCWNVYLNIYIDFQFG